MSKYATLPDDTPITLPMHPATKTIAAPSVPPYRSDPLDSLATYSPEIKILHSQLLIASTLRAQGVFGGAGPSEVRAYFERIRDQLSPNVPSEDLKRYSDIRSPGSQMMHLFLSLCAQVPQHLSDRVGGSLPARDALDCLRDEARTRKFLDAIPESLARIRKNDPSGQVHVVDAGCGPIPIMAVAAAWSDPGVYVTALELNPLSAELAQGIITALDLQDRITITCDDATTYAPSRPIDLLISETISAGLLNEPVVAVMQNLSKHLTARGETLPTGIDVHLGVFPINQFESPVGHLPYNCLTALLAPTELARISWKATSSLSRIEARMAITPSHADSVACAWLTVRLGDAALRMNESLITTPTLVNCLTSDKKIEPLIINAVPAPTSIAVFGEPGGPFLIGVLPRNE